MGDNKKLNIYTETRLHGLALSGGVGVARVCLFNENRHSNLPMYKVEGEEGIEREKNRLKRAFEIVGSRLTSLQQEVSRQIGDSEAEIFGVQKTLLEDPSLGDSMLETIEKRSTNAEAALGVVMDYYENQLHRLDSEYMQERSSDLDELRRRLLDVLANMNPSLQCNTESGQCQRGYNRIVVAEELTPSLTVELDTEHTIAFVTEHGGVNSHAAILAKALGIPAVSGIKGIYSELSCGTELLVDGDNGEVIVWPEEKTVSEITGGRREAVRPLQPVPPIPELTVLASISRATDLEHVTEMQAEGIGLYRTEFEFIAANKLLDEDEQYELYRRIAAVQPDCPAYIRLLDVGGDKPLPFLNFADEDNPYLGYRGARFLLGNPELLKTQARALARASVEGPIKMMIPMVTTVKQFKAIREMISEAVADIPNANLEYGVMFEVPSACLEADELLAEADFGSIGSNDLIQYLFAVDRNNEEVAYDYRADQPVLWELMKKIADAGREQGKTVSVCGEIAGDPTYVPELLNIGITVLSVSPRLIPGVRLTMRPDARA